MKKFPMLSRMALLVALGGAGCEMAPDDAAPEQPVAPAVATPAAETGQQAITFPPNPPGGPTTVCRWTNNTHVPVPRFPGMCWWDIVCITVTNTGISSTTSQNIWLCNATVGPNG